jgi:tetratricopeptide (TPR) repeat protein
MRKIIICIFLVLALICSCSEKNKAASDWLEKEKALWDGKQYTDPEKAIEYLSNAIKLQPDNDMTYIKRGNTYYDLGQYQQAIDDFNKVIILKPDFADAYNNRGSTYLMWHKEELVCPDFQKACELGNCKVLEIIKGKGLCR